MEADKKGYAPPLRVVEGDEFETLAHLGHHPAWPTLRSLCQARMEQEFRRTAAELMSGKEIDPATLGYRRGFFAGMKWLLDNPTLAATKLTAAIENEQQKEE